MTDPLRRSSAKPVPYLISSFQPCDHSLSSNPPLNDFTLQAGSKEMSPANRKPRSTPCRGITLQGYRHRNYTAATDHYLGTGEDRRAHSSRPKLIFRSLGTWTMRGFGWDDDRLASWNEHRSFRSSGQVSRAPGSSTPKSSNPPQRQISATSKVETLSLLRMLHIPLQKYPLLHTSRFKRGDLWSGSARWIRLEAVFWPVKKFASRSVPSSTPF